MSPKMFLFLIAENEPNEQIIALNLMRTGTITRSWIIYIIILYSYVSDGPLLWSDLEKLS